MTRHLAPTVAILLTLASLAILSGCGEPIGPSGLGGTSSGQGYASELIPRATRPAVYQAALTEMRQRFRVSQSDADLGVIQAQPQFVDSGRANSGTVRVLSSPSQMRRVARARVVSEGDQVRAEIRVLLERRDTAQVLAYRDMRNPGDVPSETPIDRGAGLDPERREVWTAVSRDFQAEREILAAIKSHFGPTTQPE